MTPPNEYQYASEMSRRPYLLTTLLLAALCCASLSRAQTPVSITDSETPIAFSTNNTGSPYTYALNSDSSVSVLQNGQLATVLRNGSLQTLGCAPFLASPSTTSLLVGAIYFDSSTNRVYIAIPGDPASVVYETFQVDGTCTFGSTANLNVEGFGDVEMTVDAVQGNVYVVVATEGGSPDTLNILNTGSFSNYPPNGTTVIPQLNLDYSASYGPIVLESSTHRIYINDFGISQNSPPGSNSTPGFFVYDPTHSSTPANNIEQVMGYVNSSGTTVPISAQDLLSDGAGKLFIINQNTAPATDLTANSKPITIINTASPFSFFANTTPASGSGFEPRVDLGTVGTPATAVSVANSNTRYSATSAADIDPVHEIIYAFAYDTIEKNSEIVAAQGTGALFSYSVSGNSENVLADSLNLPSFSSTLYGPWSLITFNPTANNLMLYTPAGALGVSTPLNTCTPFQIDQVLGGGSSSYSLSPPAFNFTTDDVYDAEKVFPNTTLFYVVPPSTCPTSTLTISSTPPPPLAKGVAGQPYGPVTFTATGGSGSLSGLAFTALGLPTGGSLAISSAGVLSGTPTQTGTFEVTISATDTNGDQGNEILPLAIGCPVITVGPNPLPAAVAGVPYNISFSQTGGIGPITYTLFGVGAGVTGAPGITFTGSGLTGVGTATGSYPIGVTATDSNSCSSGNTVLTLSVVPPRFAMAPVNGSFSSGMCAPNVFGFPPGPLPMVTINGANYYQLELNLFSDTNVAANVNLTSAKLGGIQAVNQSAPGAALFPIIFNNPGTLLPIGGCVPLTLYYPAVDFPDTVGPFSLQLAGSFSASTSPVYSGTWTLTDRHVLIGTSVENSGGVLTGSSN
jgi:hypothetical protein